MPKKKIEKTEDERIVQHLKEAQNSYSTLLQSTNIFNKKEKENIRLQEFDVIRLINDIQRRIDDAKAEQEELAAEKPDADDRRDIRDGQRELKKIGITGVKYPFVPIFEGSMLKFMSFGGYSDIEQADLFEKWLKKKKLGYSRDPNSRRVYLKKDALKAILKIWPDNSNYE